MLIETPWYYAEILGAYVKSCSGSPSILPALQNIFPQFNSVELANLYKWIRAFNCSNPNDQVTLQGFDIQQVSFSNISPAFDEWSLEQFTVENVPQLNSRLSDLRLCGPGPSNWLNRGPDNDVDLVKCQDFLKDLQTYIVNLNPKNFFALMLSSTALHYSAASVRNSLLNGIASNGSRDEGMAKMIENILANKPKGSRSVILAHIGHAGRNFQQVFNFTTKSMGTYLDAVYGKDYFVSTTFSYSLSKATWWKGEKLYQPSQTSVEGTLNFLNQGTLILDVWSNQIFAASDLVEVYSARNVIMSKHWDAVVFVPTSTPMTNYPGIVYPSP